MDNSNALQTDSGSLTVKERSGCFKTITGRTK